ncbi:amino acid permease [Trueperella pyogenes]|uniref:amino acid permease n=1 Tax=Trueperella pyogenes TaxID=1661 RepID=UPI00043AD4A8|nr:amino acid permease [Trueperella pyogenes]AHU89134.1 amino acid permease [Trueperella pyogenes]AWA43067.1 amino acid permease [Trueperella pyogenes]AZR01844.1 amino acid permease [Trueperella pyogenes]MCI7689353.1 amino acid permease [Trueperella pyogenes]MDF2420778.1 amino acid permease [Trueperella pyogenes]
MTSANSPEESLHRGLSNRNIQLIALGGAIGTGLFMGSGSTIHSAGPSIILVYLIIGFVLFLIMRAMGEILIHNLEFKSFQDFAHHLIGPWAGFITGWTYWFLWVVIAIGDMIVITGYFDYWIGNMTISAAVTLGLLFTLVLINLLTVRLFGEVEFWFSLIKIAAIVALIAVGSVMVATGFTGSSGETASFTHLWDHGGFFPTGASGFLGAFSIAIYSFIGTELIGTTAAEAKDPERTIPRAINQVPFRIAIFYVGALAVIMAITPWDVIDPERSPFVSVFAMVGLGAAASIMNFVVLTSAASSANSGIFSSSRMMYGLAQSHQAPRLFGQLSSHRVPWHALLFIGLLILIYLPILFIGGSVLKGFELIAAVATTLILFIWALILVSYIRYRKKHRAEHNVSPFKLHFAAVTPWLALAFIGFISAVLIYFPATRLPTVLTPVWFLTLGVVWAVRKRILLRRGVPLEIING